MITSPYTEKLSQRKQHNRKVFPPLAGRTKETFLKEFFPNEKNLSLSDYDAASACKFFNHEDGKLTARTTTRSTKYTSSKPKHPCASTSFSRDSNCIWELTERVDTYLMRSSVKQISKNLQYFIEQIELGSHCFADINAIIKINYSELSPLLSSYIENILKVFEEFIDYYQNSVFLHKRNTSLLESKIENIEKENFILNEKYEKIVQIKKIEDLEIQTEVDKMFPEGPYELVGLKEKLIELNKVRPQGVSDILKDVLLEMNKIRKIPSETEMNLDSLNADELVKELKGNYQIIITSTIKGIKSAYKKSFEKINVSVQTTAIYIEPKSYEDLVKQLDKVTLMYQSCQMQIDKYKEDIKTFTIKLENGENEKNQLKAEILSLKQEIDYKNKENYNIKFELENKKTEIITFQRQKTRDFDLLERKIGLLEGENSELKTNNKVLTRKEQAPINTLPAVRRKIEEETEESSNIIKKSRLDEITSSGLTVREELEKTYGKTSARTHKKTGIHSDAGLSHKANSNSDIAKQIYLDLSSQEIDSGREILDTISEHSDHYETNHEENTKKKKNPPLWVDNDEESSQTTENFKNDKKTKKKSKNNDSTKDNLKNNKKEKNKSPKKKKNEKAQNSPKNEKNGKNSKEISPTNKNNSDSVEDKPKKGKKIKEKSSDNEKTTQDKCCGKDIEAEVSIGIQVGDETEENESSVNVPRTFIHGFNPNNIYGLKGDVYYQKATFQPQARMPELFTPFQSAYVLENKFN